MIAHLKGKIIIRAESSVVLDVGGVGYALTVTPAVAAGFDLDQEASLYVYTHVREQALELYGFVSPTEKELFTLLICVSGIGPKAAMAILSVTDTATLCAAIVGEDASILTQVSGIGSKTAGRVVLELKNKVAHLQTDKSDRNTTVDLDVVEALRTMGYTNREARNALEAIDAKTQGVENKIRAALKILAK